MMLYVLPGSPSSASTTAATTTAAATTATHSHQQQQPLRTRASIRSHNSSGAGSVTVEHSQSSHQLIPTTAAATSVTTAAATAANAATASGAITAKVDAAASKHDVSVQTVTADARTTAATDKPSVVPPAVVTGSTRRNSAIAINTSTTVNTTTGIVSMRRQSASPSSRICSKNGSFMGPLTEQDETADGDDNTYYHDKVYGYLPSPGITLEELQTMVDDNGTAATVPTAGVNITTNTSNNCSVVRTASVVGEPVQQLQHGVSQTSVVVATTTTATAAVPMNLADLEKRLRREAEIRLREETARLRAEMESRYKLELDARHRREEEDKQRQKVYNAVCGAIDVPRFQSVICYWIVVDAVTLQTMVQQAVQAAFMLDTQTVAHMVMQEVASYVYISSSCSVIKWHGPSAIQL
eukprot:10123-Heterococcus_DN1.PRE.4